MAVTAPLPTIAEAAERIAAGELSPVELVEAVLERIESLEHSIRAFATVCAEEALCTAHEAGREIARGHVRGPLHGIPLGIKDLFDTAGLETACGSRLYAGRVPDHDAAAVGALKKAGAIVIGKTQMQELAIGIIDAPTRNPWNTDLVPGGSSGGSAAAVAAGECLIALGSDTGGSVRIPATLCGVTALRPTLGRISRHGMAMVSPSLDQPGPMARTALDVAHMLTILAGFDPRDRASLEVPAADYTEGLDQGIDRLVIGVATNLLPRIDAEVERSFVEALARLAELDTEIIEVELPLLEYVVPTYLPLAAAEAAAAHTDALRTRPDELGEDVRLLLEAGHLVTEADHRSARQARNLVARHWRDLFEEKGLDAVVAPGLPVPAPRANEPFHRWPDGTEEGLSSLCMPATVPSSLTGLPTLAIPCGFAASGAPVGMQVIGRPLDERTVLRIGHAYQSVTSWHLAQVPAEPGHADALVNRALNGTIRRSAWRW
jgi:aspartyl-tRNA(Asn)/glutamyl-tRNA(Gln) amidotransferase subunit A